MQVDILDRHQATGAVLRVIEELVDELAGVLVRVLQHLLDDVGGHFLQEVHRIIEEHVVNQRGQLGVGRALGDELLLVAGHVGEHVRGDVLGEHAEELEHASRVLDLLQALGDIHGRRLVRLLLELLNFALVHEPHQLKKILANLFLHRESLLSFQHSVCRAVLKMQVSIPKNGAKRRTASGCALFPSLIQPFLRDRKKAANGQKFPCSGVQRKESRSPRRQPFSGLARQTTGIVHVFHLRTNRLVYTFPTGKIHVYNTAIFAVCQPRRGEYFAFFAWIFPALFTGITPRSSFPSAPARAAFPSRACR